MDESQTTQSDTDPALAVAAVAARGTRHETPCGDGQMVWRRWGSGPPVVLIHGGAGSWTHWIRNVVPLSERYSVWVLDIPGFGESALPQPESIEGIADIVEQGMQALIPQHKAISIVGFSFGSSISSIIATRLKERLRNLVIMGARFSMYAKRVRLQLVSWKKLADPAERLAAHRRNLEIMMIANPRNVDALAAYLQSQNAPGARASPRRWTPSSDDKLLEYFPQVRARGHVMVIYGRGDKGSQSMVDDNGAALYEMQPNVKFRIIENAGHWVQYEGAAQMNELLLDTLMAGS